MLSDDDFRQFDRFLDWVGDAVSGFPNTYRSCTLDAVTRGSEPFFCIIRTGVKGKYETECLDYGRVQLKRETFPVSELRNRIEELNQTGKLASEQGCIALNLRNNTPQRTYHPSHSEYHPWPGHLFQMGTSEGIYHQPEPLVGRGLPPFFDTKDAIRHRIRIPVGDNDSRFGRLLLFIPDFTARLEKMSFAEGVLRVRSTFAPGTHVDISVLAADINQTFRKTQPLQKTQSFKLMANPTSLRIFVTGGNGDVLDSFSEEQGWATRERVIFAGAKYSKTSMEMIRRGESDTIEFKTFIRLDDKSKTAEIVKAVISFANTAGGTIFIGVSDDADIQGIDAHVPHQKTVVEFEAEYFAAIRRLLQQKLNRIPTLETDSERIGDKTVFVIGVAEGSAKPYFNVQTREIFVRRGASDVRPDPDADLRQMVDSRRGMDFPLPGWNQ